MVINLILENVTFLSKWKVWTQNMFWNISQFHRFQSMMLFKHLVLLLMMDGNYIRDFHVVKSFSQWSFFAQIFMVFFLVESMFNRIWILVWKFCISLHFLCSRKCENFHFFHKISQKKDENFSKNNTTEKLLIMI